MLQGQAVNPTYGAHLPGRLWVQASLVSWPWVGHQGMRFQDCPDTKPLCLLG